MALGRLIPLEEPLEEIAEAGHGLLGFTEGLE
jgi:hypothetical protein